jgi:hypothetical protein
MRKTLLRAFFLTTLLGFATLGASAAQAAQGPLRLAGSLNLFAKGLAAAFGWLDIGCSIDPSGACRPSPPPASQLDGGCRIDPQDGCQHSSQPADQLNIGCSIDPQGGCQTGTGN